MGVRTRIFIDFWNFQLNWNDRSSGANCDWIKLPAILLREAEGVLAAVGIQDGLTLEETVVHASVNPAGSDGKLKGWLQGFLDNQPSYRVQIRERRVRMGGIHCKACGTQHDRCPTCDEPFKLAPEKGVDTAIVTDLLSLATEGAFELAILVTADADLVPAVEWVQERGRKVINARWDKHGFDLAHACWGQFKLDPLIGDLARP